MALSDNLVAYWSLEEASGTRADAHGSNDLTDNNTVASGTGKVGTCADFERDNSEYLSIADNADMSVGDIDFTFALWINFEANGNYRAPFGKGSGGGVDLGEYGLILNQDDSNKALFYVSPDGSSPYAEVVGDTFGGLSAATWYFVVCWHDSVNNQLGLSINDTADTVSHSGGVRNGAGDFYLGWSRRPVGDNYWDGLIDEVGFWKRVLSSAERTELYNGGSGRDYAYITGGGGGGDSTTAHRLLLLGVG